MIYHPTYKYKAGYDMMTILLHTRPFVIVLLCSITMMSCASPQKTITVKTTEQLLNDIAKGIPLSYQNITFEGDLDLTQLKATQLTHNNFLVHISSPIYFERCQFKGKVIGFAHRGDTAHTLRFTSAVSFYNCHFKQEVDFRGATFDHHLYFNSSIFDQTTLLQATRIDGDLRFEKAIFNKDLQLQESVVRGTVWGKEATVLGQFSTQQADFWQNAVFASIHIYGYADFGLTNFRRSAFFEYGKYNGRVNYNSAIFGHRAEWTKVQFDKEVYFDKSWFSYRPVFSDLINKTSVDLSNSRLDDGNPDKIF